MAELLHRCGGGYQGWGVWRAGGRAQHQELRPVCPRLARLDPLHVPDQQGACDHLRVRAPGADVPPTPGPLSRFYH